MNQRPAGRVVAGVDIGNSTTEVVLAVVTDDGPQPLAWDRVLTRGAKGSPGSVEGAATLVARLAREAGTSVDVVAVAPLRPVTSAARLVPVPSPATGRLQVLGSGAATAAGGGFGAGRPVDLADLTGQSHLPDDEVVVCVTQSHGFREAARHITAALDAGVHVTAVVASGDEAVLIANRLPARLPVVDEVDTERALSAERVLVEVQPPGHPVQRLADAFAVATASGLPTDDEGLRTVLGLVADASNGVLAVVDRPPPTSADAEQQPWLERGTQELSLAELAEAAPTQDRSGRWHDPAERHELRVDDVAVVDLDALAAALVTRTGAVDRRALAVALLHEEPATDASDLLADLTGLSVAVAPGEAAASRAGALTTPGTDATTAVVDVGGGTVDVLVDGVEQVTAGAGELVTVATAHLLAIPAGAAEWAKRGPSHRVETPHLLVGEDGSRTLTDVPVPAHLVGALAAPGPAGWLGLGGRLSASEWRALRLALKRAVLGAAVERARERIGAHPTSWVVVGGPAGDDEVVATLTRALPSGSSVGRGDVAGRLGHRYAVAWGLVLQARD